MDTTELVEEAKRAQRNSYSPYSNFPVGAAVLGCGKIHTGSNVENASFGLTMCAERVAIFNAVSHGCRKLDAIAVYADKKAYPCGACLQVMSEFCDGDCEIIIAYGDAVERHTLDELMPKRFSLKDY